MRVIPRCARGCVCVFVPPVVYLCQTKHDFTTMGGGLFALLMCLIGLGFVQLIFASPLVETIYAALGALVFSLYIIYDVQVGAYADVATVAARVWSCGDGPSV